jgi:protein TonB
MRKVAWAAIAALLTPTANFAQEPTGSAQVSGPPSAKVACTAGDYFYWACHVVSETPEGQGIGAAAARFVACLRGPKKAGQPKAEVVVPVVFKGLTPQQVTASVMCPFDPAEPAELPGGTPAFLHQLTGSDMQKFPPERAIAQRVGGAVVIECQAVQDTYKNCRILRETPQGYGFSQHAMGLATLIRLRPLDQDGQPVEGRRFRFSIGSEVSP